MVGSQRMRRYAATFEAQLYLSILPVLNDRPVLNIRRRTTTYGAIAMMVPNMPTANHNQGEFQFQNSFFACSCVPGCCCCGASTMVGVSMPWGIIDACTVVILNVVPGAAPSPGDRAGGGGAGMAPQAN